MDPQPVAVQQSPLVQSRGTVKRGWLRYARSPHVILFLLLVCVFVYTPPRWQDWNQNSRFSLTRAIVEQQRVQIDDYARNTGDYALINGHLYSDKAPGVSLMAVPVYAVTETLQPFGLSALSERVGASGGFGATLNPTGDGLSSERVDVAVSLYIATVLVVGIPAALGLVLLALVVERLAGCRTAGILTALIVGLATPFFPYAQAFYGHVPAAVCMITALALIVLRPGENLSTAGLLGIGALLGWAVVIEYPAAVAGLPVALWAVWLARERAVVYGVLGALPALAVLAVYDLIAYGTLLPTGYQHSALWQEQHSTGFMSLTYPHWDALYGLTWSPFRGLFFFAPVLLLAVPGVWIALREDRQRTATLVALASFGMFFLFIASSIMWWGGFSVGPRYLVPAIPMLALPLGTTIAWLNSRPLRKRAVGSSVSALLAAFSGLLIWSTTFAGQSYPSDATRDPLGDYVLPAMQSGEVARNLGMALQLEGLLSLVPLVFVVALGVVQLGLNLIPARETAS